MLGRLAGRFLNTTLGWATILLFGKVAGRRQALLLVIALGSLLWIATVAGVVVPEVGTFLIAFVPLPESLDDNLVRLVMLGMALLLPLMIGAGALYLTEASRRPGGVRLIGALFRGYPFTLVLAITIVLLGAVALVRKVHSMARRWDSSHVPIVVKPGGYEEVLRQLEAVLDGAGVAADRRPAPAVLSVPPKLLDRVAGNALGSMVPDRLAVLTGAGVEILVYPSDVAIAGTKDLVARARSATAAQLTAAPAYLTTSEEAQRIEDELRKLAQLPAQEWGTGTAARQRLQRIDDQLARLTVPFDEWETVYRQRLQVERDLLAADHTRPGPEARELVSQPTPPDRVIGLAGVSLILLDALLLLADRIRPARSGR
jgi:hypothetical protein